jgi:hypothetical protein
MMTWKLLTTSVLALAATTNGAGASETIVGYQAASKSPPFEIAAGVKSWSIVWQCEGDNVPFSLSNPDNGHLLDAFFSFSGKGDTLRTDKGRFLIDTNGNKCNVTVSKVD